MTKNLPTTDNPLKIGTRASPLALAQAYEVRNLLMRAHNLPEDAFEIVPQSTLGDRVQDRSLRALGGKGLFSKEIEEHLLNGHVDIAVHSTKDMAVEQPEGLTLDVFLKRENPHDAFVSKSYKSIPELPMGATVGTSSLRRKAQLLNQRPDLNVIEFRGSVQTRLQKLDAGLAEATFLAMAGLNRLGQENTPAHEILSQDMLPAVAQGVISIERRTDDRVTKEIIAPLNHRETALQMQAERAFLKELDGSCQTPIAGIARIKGEQIHLKGQVLRTDGSEEVSKEIIAHISEAEACGITLAQEILCEIDTDFFK